MSAFPPNAGIKRPVPSGSVSPDPPSKIRRRFFRGNDEYRNNEEIYVKRKLKAGRVDVPKNSRPGSPLSIPFYRYTAEQALPSRYRTDAWLARSSTWRDMPSSWKGVKALGKGGYGICGLWEFDGPEKAKKRCVVKQLGYRSIGTIDTLSLRWEAEKLDLCQKLSPTDHVVKLIKSCEAARGTGADPEWDPADKPILRMIIEYCDKGDMESYIEKSRRKFTRDNPFPEEAIWRIWECLAKACMVLETGQEQALDKVWILPDEYRPEGYSVVAPIVHFDIKPANIFLGGDNTQPGTHQKTDIFKLGDFGLARNLPPGSGKAGEKLPAWIRHTAWRFTPGWGAPEQTFQKTFKYGIGPAVNVWCVAKCIYALAMRGYLFNETQRFEATVEPGHKFWTFGVPLLGKDAPPYSKSLIGLLLKCLAQDPDERPNASEVLQQIQFVTAAYKQWAQDSPGSYDFSDKLLPAQYGFSQGGPYFPLLNMEDEPDSDQFLAQNTFDPDMMQGPGRLSPVPGFEWSPLGPTPLVPDNQVDMAGDDSPDNEEGGVKIDGGVAEDDDMAYDISTDSEEEGVKIYKDDSRTGARLGPGQAGRLFNFMDLDDPEEDGSQEGDGIYDPMEV